MKKKAEILKQYRAAVFKHGREVTEDISLWERRHDVFADAYALGWVLGIADIDTDEEISHTINMRWHMVKYEIANNIGVDPLAKAVLAGKSA